MKKLMLIIVATFVLGACGTNKPVGRDAPVAKAEEQPRTVSYMHYRLQEQKDQNRLKHSEGSEMVIEGAIEVISLLVIPQ